jgi:hypothetical protein
MGGERVERPGLGEERVDAPGLVSLEVVAPVGRARENALEVGARSRHLVLADRIRDERVAGALHLLDDGVDAGGISVYHRTLPKGTCPPTFVLPEGNVKWPS